MYVSRMRWFTAMKGTEKFFGLTLKLLYVGPDR